MDLTEARRLLVKTDRLFWIWLKKKNHSGRIKYENALRELMLEADKMQEEDKA